MLTGPSFVAISTIHCCCSGCALIIALSVASSSPLASYQMLLYEPTLSPCLPSALPLELLVPTPFNFLSELKICPSLPLKVKKEIGTQISWWWKPLNIPKKEGKETNPPVLFLPPFKRIKMTTIVWIQNGRPQKLHVCLTSGSPGCDWWLTRVISPKELDPYFCAPWLSAKHLHRVAQTF